MVRVTLPARPGADSEPTERATVHRLPRRAFAEQRLPDFRPGTRRAIRIDSFACSESVVVSLKGFLLRALPERLRALRTGAVFAAGPPPGPGGCTAGAAPVMVADAEALSSAD